MATFIVFNIWFIYLFTTLQITELLGVDSEMSSDSLSTKYCSGISPLLNYSGMKPEVHKLIHSLVLHIHKNESDIEKSILIFLPTYYALEQQWYLLEPLSSSFKVHILHRSIDTEQALMAMKIWKSHRKVHLHLVSILFFLILCITRSGGYDKLYMYFSVCYASFYVLHLRICMNILF